MEQETPVQPGAITMLEAELGETLRAIADSFGEARTLDHRIDEFGNRRSSVVNDAVKLLKVSAEIGLAIAKIRGEYNHNINVLHGEIWPPPRRVVNKPETFEEGRPTRQAVAEAVAKTAGYDPRRTGPGGPPPAAPSQEGPPGI